MKPLDAKVQIHRLAKQYRSLSDIPYKNTEEKKQENELFEAIKQIVTQIEFKNRTDMHDFDEFLEQQLLGDLNFKLPDPVGIADQDLSDELRTTAVLPQIKKLREKKKHIDEELHELQQRKKDLELIRKKENLKKQVERMEQQVEEQLREEKYFTDKKDKDGLVKLRKEKYNKHMDELKFDEFRLKELLEAAKDKDEIKTIKEALKLKRSEINKLKLIKVQTYFQNAMIKIPRWINKGTSAVAELSDGLSKMGGDLGKMGNTGDDFGDFKINEDPFDIGGTRKKTTPKKSSKKKSKKSKKKSKKKKETSTYDYGFNEKSFYDY